MKYLIINLIESASDIDACFGRYDEGQIFLAQNPRVDNMSADNKHKLVEFLRDAAAEIERIRPNEAERIELSDLMLAQLRLGFLGIEEVEKSFPNVTKLLLGLEYICRCGHRARDHADHNGLSHPYPTNENGVCGCVFSKEEALDHLK